MAKQNDVAVCIQCEQELQLKVNFCPFCGTEHKEQPKTQPAASEPAVIQNEEHAIVPEQNEVHSGQPKSEIADSVQQENTSAIVKHITKQTNKELLGVIILGSTLEQMRSYDPYAFKKNDGIFVRLKHLEKIPNEFLTLEQHQLKFQNNIQDLNVDIEAWEEQPANAGPNKAEESPLPPPVPEPVSQLTPLDPPAPKKSSFKYIVIAFIVILAVIYLMLSGKEETQEEVITEDPLVDHCESANAEITSLLSEKMPTRALSIIKLNQTECKTNANFVQLVVSAEAQATSAKEKLALAKEYIQASNLDLAHQTLLAALELDSELVGGAELLQQVESMIEEFNLQQEEVEVPLESEAVQDAAQNLPPQNMHQEAEQAQRLAQAEREKAEARRQAEQVQKQAEQAQRERQKAEEAARKQAAEAAGRQNEARFDGQLSRAERALNANNYGLAKSLAREVLSNAPNNTQAKRILRQAEAGESKAFDDMVIE